MAIRSLHVYDVDGTLYRSPKSPDGSESFYFHAKSFGQIGLPGYDPKWYLDVVSRARQSVEDPSALVIVCTGRIDHAEMRKKITELLGICGVTPDFVHLRPTTHQSSMGSYKAKVVASYLLAEEALEEVILYDDEEGNHDAIARLCEFLGVRFRGVMTRGF